ncbi:MAG: repressor LexA [Gemmatimonadetes bacterium]|nr:repressor LexA [Gemmatimonadota bacterium]
MSEQLTVMERKVYHYLIDFLAENTYQPSVRDIGRRFRIKSTKTVSDLLQSLAAKGYIERDASRSRGVRLLGVQSVGGTQPIPVFAEDSALDPQWHGGEPDDWLTLDRRFVPSDDVVFLRTNQDRFATRGVLEGDYVMVSPSARAGDGDLIAARVGQRIVTRTLTHRGAAIVLEGDGGTEEDLTVGPTEDFQVLGVVVGVWRPTHDRPVAVEA